MFLSLYYLCVILMDDVFNILGNGDRYNSGHDL